MKTHNLTRSTLFVSLVIILGVLLPPFSAQAGLFDFTLSVQVEGNGTTNPAPGNHSIGWFSNVTLTATPDAGWKFSRWEVSYADILPHIYVDNPRTTFMHTDKIYKAVFTPAVPADAVLVSPDGIGFMKYLDQAHDKVLVHVEGDPYQMGYQHGYLLAEKVRYQCSDDFFKSIVTAFGVDILNDICNDPNLYNPIRDAVMAWTLAQSVIYCPPEFLSEINGIVNGARDRLAQLGQDYSQVTYGRVVLENLAFDALLGFFYPLVTSDYMTPEEAAQFWATFLTNGHMCDGFVALNSATATNGTLMARSFQIDPAVTNYSAFIEYFPYEGNNFIAVNPPGFVGTCVAMNEHGLAIGNDMIPAMVTNPITMGMGTQMTARYVMQYTNNCADAADQIKNSIARGVPWTYIIGDKNSGVIAEAAPTLLPGFLPSQADYFAARWTDYVLPDGAHPSPLVQQIEFRDDLVGVANHYLDPTVYNSCGSSVEAGGDSVDRYAVVVNEALAAINSSGVTVAEAKYICDHLVRNWSPTDKVNGVNAVFDMENMTINAHWNNVGDPWIAYSFPGYGVAQAYKNHTLPGTIEAEDFDNGGQNYGYYDTTAGNLYGSYRSTDVDIHGCSEGGYTVGGVAHNEWLNYTLHDVEDGLYTIQLRVTTALSGKSIAVSEPHVRSFGLVAVPNTGGWGNYTNVEYTNVYLHSGMNAVRVRFEGGSVNLNYIKFIRTGDFDPQYVGHAVPGVIQAENYDKGGAAIAYVDADAGNTGGQYRADDVDLALCSEGNYCVGWIQPGEWLNYTFYNGGAGVYTIQFRVAGWSTNAKSLTLSTPDAVLGTVNVPDTGGYQNWTTVQLTGVTIPGDVTSVRVAFNGANINFSKMTFIRTTSFSSPYKVHTLPGTIEAEDYNSGGQGYGYSDTTAGNTGGYYRNDDVDIATCVLGGYQVGWTSHNEWLDYTLNPPDDNGGHYYTVHFDVASNNANGAIEVSVNGVVKGTVAVPNTGGYQTYQTVSLDNVLIGYGYITEPILRLRIINGSFDIDKIRFVETCAFYLD